MFDAVDIPPFEKEKLVCGISAAIEYNVPVDIMLAIADIEAGKPFTVSVNSNGTFDIGVMQFNTAYLQDLQKFGISAEDVKGTGCYPYRLAAWRIRRHIEYDKGDIWTKAANYHSRTPEYNTVYQAKLKKKAHKWALWLQSHFDTTPYSELEKQNRPGVK